MTLPRRPAWIWHRPHRPGAPCRQCGHTKLWVACGGWWAVCPYCDAGPAGPPPDPPPDVDRVRDQNW